MAESSAPLAERIAAQLGHLTPKQQRVSRYFVDHPAEVAFTSANELAKRLGVNAATIVRLSRVLGYAGYPDLQRHVRDYFPHHYPALAQSGENAPSDGKLPDVLSRAFAQDIENLRYVSESIAVQELEAIVEVLLGARRILLFGGGVASGVTAYLASSLRTMGLPVNQVTEGAITLTQEIENLGRDDVAFGVSFYRYLSETLDALDRARENGATTIALTDSPVSPAAQYASRVLCAPVESTTHRISLVAPMAVTNALLSACVLRGGARVSDMLDRLDQQYRKKELLVFE